MQILIIIFVKPVQLWSRLMVILSYLPFTKSKKKNNFCWLLFNFISTLYLYACNSLDLHFFYTSKVEILEISRKWTFLQLKISDSLDFTKVAETPCLLSSVVVEYSITLVKEYDLVCSKGNVPKMFILLFNVGMTLGTVFYELFSIMFEIQFLFIFQTNKVRSLLENSQTNLDEQKV